MMLVIIIVYSINVQQVCDAKYRILNVVASWPCSTRDSRMLEESPLDDPGYALKPWRMTHS